MKRFYIPLKLSTAQMLYYFESRTKQLLTYCKDQGVPIVPLCPSTVWVNGLLLMATFSNKIICCELHWYCESKLIVFYEL